MTPHGSKDLLLKDCKVNILFHGVLENLRKTGKLDATEYLPERRANDLYTQPFDVIKIEAR